HPRPWGTDVKGLTALLQVGQHRPEIHASRGQRLVRPLRREDPLQWNTAAARGPLDDFDSRPRRTALRVWKVIWMCILEPDSQRMPDTRMGPVRSHDQ